MNCSQPSPNPPSPAADRRRAPQQSPAAASIPDAWLRLETAGEISGLSVPTLYRKARTDPTFPKLVKIGRRCTRIRAGDLTAWLAAQAKAC